MPAWTDDPSTSSTHIRAIHINELRRAVNFYFSGAGFSPFAWTDGPWVTISRHFRAVHFTEMQSAIQQLWNYKSLGPLPNWSVGTAPSTSRQVSARDVNDLRSWLNTYDPGLNIWTGFHWCSPVSAGVNNSQCNNLLSSAGRWGAVILAYAGSPGNAEMDFTDACDLMAGQPAALSQSVARIVFDASITYGSDPGQINRVASANAWLNDNGFYADLDYFAGGGGSYVVIFNELQNGMEPQVNIDPRILGCLALALQQRYTNPDGTRTLLILFPGPSGLLNDQTAFSAYWNSPGDPPYDLNGETFDAYYAGQDLDPALTGRTMLYHSGSGVFDGVVLHCYDYNPANFGSRTPGISSDPAHPASQALQYIIWMLAQDNSSPIFITESGGQCMDPSATCPDGSACFGDSTCAGAALAQFELNVSQGNANQIGLAFNMLVKAVYGYILDPSNLPATSDGWHEINTSYLGAYTTEREALGFD